MTESEPLPWLWSASRSAKNILATRRTLSGQRFDQRHSFHRRGSCARRNSSASIRRRFPTSMCRCTPTLLLGANDPFRLSPPTDYLDENYYWMQVMARLRPGVTLAQAQAQLAPQFHQWVATTATNDKERSNLPDTRSQRRRRRNRYAAPPILQAVFSC